MSDEFLFRKKPLQEKPPEYRLGQSYPRPWLHHPYPRKKIKFLSNAFSSIDLSGYSCSIEGSATWGNTFSFTTQLINNGISDSGPFKVSWYVSDSTVPITPYGSYLIPLSNSSEYYYHDNIPGLSLGPEFTVELTMPESPISPISGSICILQRIDVDDVVEEYNESNNFGELGEGIDCLCFAPIPTDPCAGPFLNGTGTGCGCPCRCCPPPCCDSVELIFKCGTSYASWPDDVVPNEGCLCGSGSPCGGGTCFVTCEDTDGMGTANQWGDSAGGTALCDLLLCPCPLYDVIGTSCTTIGDILTADCGDTGVGLYFKQIFSSQKQGIGFGTNDSPFQEMEDEYLFALCAGGSGPPCGGGSCEVPCNDITVTVTTSGCCLEGDSSSLVAVGDGTVTASAGGSADAACGTITPYVNGTANSAVVSDGDAISITLQSADGSCCPCIFCSGSCTSPHGGTPLAVFYRKRNIKKGIKNKILVNKKALIDKVIKQKRKLRKR